MYLLHNIGSIKHNSNYNTIEEILASEGPLSFDGVYKNVYEHRHQLVGKDITLFVTGDYVGKDNSFDVGQRLEKFCDWNEIIEIVKVTKAKLGWHSWSHRDLTKLTQDEIRKEVTPPFMMAFFAYPYGKFNENVLNAVEDYGYWDAYSVTQGNGSQYQLTRKYLC